MFYHHADYYIYIYIHNSQLDQLSEMWPKVLIWTALIKDHMHSSGQLFFQEKVLVQKKEMEILRHLEVENMVG